MRKGTITIIGVIVVIILVVGGFALFHKSNKTTPTTTSTNSSSKNSTAPAVNNAVLTTKTDATLGQYLANSSGMALYTYGGDSTGVSNCSGSCLASWPAYQPTSSTTSLPTGVSVITRTDNGQKQYAYNGMPLYTFADDSAGQVTGNGVSNFTVAKPSTTSTAPSSSSSSNPYNY